MAKDYVSNEIEDVNGNWLSALERYRVAYIILSARHDGDIIKALRSQDDWMVDFEDKETVIFARTMRSSPI